MLTTWRLFAPAHLSRTSTLPDAHYTTTGRTLHNGDAHCRQLCSGKAGGRKSIENGPPDCTVVAAAAAEAVAVALAAAEGRWALTLGYVNCAGHVVACEPIRWRSTPGNGAIRHHCYQHAGRRRGKRTSFPPHSAVQERRRTLRETSLWKRELQLWRKFDTGHLFRPFFTSGRAVQLVGSALREFPLLQTSVFTHRNTNFHSNPRVLDGK